MSGNTFPPAGNTMAVPRILIVAKVPGAAKFDSRGLRRHSQPPLVDPRRAPDRRRPSPSCCDRKKVLKISIIAPYAAGEMSEEVRSIFAHQAANHAGAVWSNCHDDTRHRFAECLGGLFRMVEVGDQI
ncbi:hypothetical protein FQN51_009586 [Onygenales sp. PD_10]|nr:hypothetical protein FQN51_009586 [Onygenales sp. PD_10]